MNFWLSVVFLAALGALGVGCNQGTERPGVPNEPAGQRQSAPSVLGAKPGPDGVPADGSVEQSRPGPPAPGPVDQRVAALNGQLERETADSAWAPQAERRAWDNLNDREFRGSSLRLSEARCKSTLCRYVITWSDAEDAAEIKRKLADAGLCVGACQMFFAERTGETVVWYSRPGLSLPDAEGKVHPIVVQDRSQASPAVP